MRKVTFWRGGVVAAAMLVVALWAAPAARGAPPGWQLRNGSWVPLVQPSDEVEGQVVQMMQDLAAGRTKQVIVAAKKWEKRHAAHPLMPQVLMLQGDAEVRRGSKYTALYSYEDMLNNYPASELYLTVLGREYDIADSFLRGYKRKFLGMRILGAADDAIDLLDRIQDRERGSALAERAGIRVADYYYSQGRFAEAVDAYTDFLRRYPISQYVRKAEIRRAEASLANFRGAKFDATPLLDGQQRLQAIQQAYPQTSEDLQVGALTDRIYQLEGVKELEIARYYWRAGQKHAALYYYQRVQNNWPDTLAARDAQKEMQARFPQEAQERPVAAQQGASKP